MPKRQVKLGIAIERGKYGYPKKTPQGWVLQHGNRTYPGEQVNCTKIRPGQPGHWIDSERCSYRFKIDKNWYACRGYGEGIAVSCKRMKKGPRR